MSAAVVQVEVAPTTWKANRVAVLVAVSKLRSVRGMPGELEATVTAIVEVAKETEEEAWRTPDAWRLPDTWRLPAMEEEAEEINPLPMVNWPVVEALASEVSPVTLKVPVAVMLAKEDKPFTRRVLEALMPSFNQTEIVVVGVRFCTPKLSC